MLLRILRTHLAPYRAWLAVIVVLQFTSTVAMLYLPSLNADIIDNGIAVNDNDYILRVGMVMLGVSLLQVLCSVVAVIAVDAEHLSLPVERVVELVRGLTFAASHPHLTEQRPLTPEEIVDVILHGVLRPTKDDD